MRQPGLNDIETRYLHPGEICICAHSVKVITVLGSCVSITMFNSRLQMGAICHATLPRCRSVKEECIKPCIDAFKYTDCAIHHMLRAFSDRGIMNSEIEIKLFGGADTLNSRSSNAIGSQNIRTALHVIRKEKLSVAAADVGDSFGRKLIFFTRTGEVFLKRLRNGNGLPAGNGRAFLR